jgi:excisionase family DNA binding protein
MDKTDPIFVRPIEAARMLSVSRSRIYQMLNTGALPAIRLEGRTWRVVRAAIEKMAADALAERDRG